MTGESTPSRDAGVIRRGGNVTASTRLGALDVVQRAQGVPSYAQLAEDAVESELLGVPRSGSARFAACAR